MLRLAFSTIAVLALAASAAHADPDPEAAPWRVDIGSSTRWLGDTSAAAVTTETLGLFVLSGERHVGAVELPRGPSIDLALFGSFASGGATGRMFQTLVTSVDTVELAAGVHATARLYGVLLVSARAGVGADDVSLTIAPTARPRMASVDDHGWGRLASASLGAEIEPLKLPILHLGFGAEVGYVTTSSVDMHAYPSDRGAPDLTIQTAFASVGHLDLDGWSLRITAHLVF
jgi:hypothetical protein